MKIALITVFRHYEKYAIEFVEHYLSIGVDRLIIVDNNEYGYPIDLSDILSEYIKSNKVIISRDITKTDYKNANFFKELYNSNKKYYDWFIMVTMDKFLQIPEVENNDIKIFLSQEKFNDYNEIGLTSFCRHDVTNKVHYENKPLVERFNDENYKKNEKCNLTIYSIIKGNLDINYCSEHDPHDNKKNYGKIIRCYADGSPKHRTTIATEEKAEEMLNYAYFNSYQYKTIEEFLDSRVVKEHVRSRYEAEKLYTIFIIHNDETEEILSYKNQLFDSLDLYDDLEIKLEQDRLIQEEVENIIKNEEV